MSPNWPDSNIRAGFWLGPAGGLMPLPDLRGDLSVSGYPRDWSVTIPQASPAEVAALYAMAVDEVAFTLDLSGVRRASVPPHTLPSAIGPFHWVTPYSRVTNLLPPRAVTGPQGWGGWSGRTQGGPVALEDGMAASSIQLTAAADSFSPLLPVVPEQRVTASVYARKHPSVAGTFRLDWMNLGGSFKSVAGSRTVTTAAAPLERLSVSTVVPADVHLARLTLTGVPQYAMPALTWTNQVQDRSAGQGCAQVVVHGLSSSPVSALEDGARESVSFTVSEVG